MKRKNVFVRRKLIAKKSIDELDLVLHDEFKFDYEKYGEFITIQLDRDYGSAYDATPIKIDKMITTLLAMKKKGATHVEIQHNVDHHGYDIAGLLMRFADQTEIDKFLSDEAKHETKAEKIRKLQQEIDIIRNEKV